MPFGKLGIPRPSVLRVGGVVEYVMLFRQLEYFVALARERHFARAADACYVSQPALSEAIRKLERELKVPLVQRGRTFEGLTPEGERLVLWARRILADHTSLQQEVNALQTGLTGQLRVGVIPAAAATVALLTDPFCAEHPLVNVRLETSLTSADIVDRIRRLELDAGVIYSDGQDTSGLSVTPLYFEQQVLLAGSDLLTGQSGTISWLDVVELPLCLLRRLRLRGSDRCGQRGCYRAGSPGAAARDRGDRRFRLNGQRELL